MRSIYVYDSKRFQAKKVEILEFKKIRYKKNLAKKLKLDYVNFWKFGSCCRTRKIENFGFLGVKKAPK